MWGGEVELVALSKLLKRRIVLYQEKAVDQDWHQHQSHQQRSQPQVTVRQFGEEFGDKEEPVSTKNSVGSGLEWYTDEHTSF